MKEIEEKKNKEKQNEKEERLKKLKQQHEELIRQKNEREEAEQKGKEHLKIYAQKTPLYQELNQKYEQEILMPELEKRKEELKKRRELFSSINSEELRKHNQEYSMRQEELRLQRERQKKQRLQELQNHYNSQSLTALKDLLEKERQIKEEIKAKQKEKFELLDKQNKYAQIIRSTQLPVASIKKKQELEELQKERQTIPRQEKQKEVKEIAINQKWHTPANQVKKDKDGKWRELNSRERQRIASLTPKPKTLSQPEIPIPNSAKYRNYLQEIVQQKESNYKESKTPKIMWQSYLENPNIEKNDKMQKIKQKADLLEDAAKRSELKMSKIQDANKQNLNLNKQISNLYIDSIKAKLVLLENI